MKTFLYSIPNKIQAFSKKLDAKSALCGKSWEVFNDEGVKQLFIFNEDESILITNNGKVLSASWTFISQNSSILITTDDETIMFRPAFFNKEVFALQRDGTERYLLMIDEQKMPLFAHLTLDALMAYIEKEIAWSSMDAEEQKRLLELEKQREIEEKKRLREIEKQQEEEARKKQLEIEEQKKEEELRLKEEQEQRKKQAEKGLILEYMREHKDEISNQLLKRKKIGKIGAILSVVLLPPSFIIPSVVITTAIVLFLVIVAIACFGISMSSYIDVVRPHIDNGILYHTELEVRKMYEEL